MQHKVFQWASGSVGRQAAHAVLKRDDCVLVGLHTTSDAKLGRDIGELVGVEPLGIRATGDVEPFVELARAGSSPTELAPRCYASAPLGANRSTLCVLRSHPMRRARRPLSSSVGRLSTP